MEGHEGIDHGLSRPVATACVPRELIMHVISYVYIFIPMSNMTQLITSHHNRVFSWKRLRFLRCLLRQGSPWCRVRSCLHLQ